MMGPSCQDMFLFMLLLIPVLVISLSIKVKITIYRGTAIKGVETDSFKPFMFM